MRKAWLGPAGAALAIAIACSSAPKYPACERDDQCAVAAKHDYCVDGKCVYCRTSSDCNDRERCRRGRCENDPDAPFARLDAGDDGDTDASAEEDAGASGGDESEDDKPRERHVLPRGVRRFLRP